LVAPSSDVWVGAGVCAASPVVSKLPSVGESNWCEGSGVAAGVGCGFGLGVRTWVRGEGVATGVVRDERSGVTGTETSETAGVTAPLLSIRGDLAVRAALARGARSAGTAHTAERPTAASDPSLL
jgi:hypothetical protein